MPIPVDVREALNVLTYSGKAFVCSRSHTNYLVWSLWSGGDNRVGILVTDIVKARVIQSAMIFHSWDNIRSNSKSLKSFPTERADSSSGDDRSI